MNSAEDLAKALMIEIKDEYEKSRRHCLKCVWWITADEICDKYKSRPPLDVIVSGCPDYDLLPF